VHLRVYVVPSTTLLSPQYLALSTYFLMYAHAR
jgi:hypothetical protein